MRARDAHWARGDPPPPTAPVNCAPSPRPSGKVHKYSKFWPDRETTQMFRHQQRQWLRVAEGGRGWLRGVADDGSGVRRPLRRRRRMRTTTATFAFEDRGGGMMMSGGGSEPQGRVCLFALYLYLTLSRRSKQNLGAFQEISRNSPGPGPFQEVSHFFNNCYQTRSKLRHDLVWLAPVWHTK